MTTDKPDLVRADVAQTEEIRQLLAKAERGETAVLPQLQKILDENPHVWKMCGDLAWRVETTLLNLVAGKNLVTAESIKRRLAELKAELGPSPMPLEKLLIDRVALEWLFLHFSDLATLEKHPADDFLPPLTGKYKEEKRDAAHRRFLRSIKVLADVRRLLRPRAAPLDIARMTEGGRSPGHPLPWPLPGGQRGRVHSRSVTCVD